MNFERATAKKIVNLEKFRTAQRFALGAVGGTGILPENGTTPKPKNCSKRGADPPSPARCVGLTPSDGNETLHRSCPQANDHFLKRLFTAKATLPASQPRKRHRPPVQPARRKRTLFCSPELCQTDPNENGTLQPKPFQPKTETA